MKKTIAILLVLVIGMVGVWAATADLNLTTKVYEFNEMKITETPTPATWTAFPSNPLANTNPVATTYTTNANRKSVDPYVTTSQNVGYLQTRTNIRRGYTVSITATQLSSTEGATGSEITQVINYAIYNDTSLIYTTADTAPAAATFLSVSNGTGMRATTSPINVILSSTGDELSAGTYNGDITFTYTAN